MSTKSTVSTRGDKSAAMLIYNNPIIAQIRRLGVASQLVARGSEKLDSF